MTEINPVFRKASRFGLIALFIFFGALTTGVIINTYTLLSKSYYINEAELVKLDTIHILGKVYQSAGGKSSSHGFEFESIDRHNFRISGERYHSIAEIKELTDTLRYYEVNFTAYTDREGIEIYKSGSARPIEIYQLSIGGKNYMNIEDMNQRTASTLTWISFLGLSFLVCLSIGLYQKWEIIKEGFSRKINNQ
jgi:hypothetical protein